MRLGLLGPSQGDEDAIRDAVEFLLGDAEVDEALYLGEDDGALERVLSAVAKDLFGGPPSDDTFLDRAAELGARGTPEQIDALLEADASLRRLATIRKLPPSPTRAVEMLADRIMLAVHDKAVLDEEDIANAHLIVYGRSEQASLRRFGPRAFLTPGPLTARKVLLIDVEEQGLLTVSLFETTGLPVWRETVGRKTARVQVSR
ncbi:MAG: hypothetical protein ACFCGT_06275 [Sandaracinaceae bacterium]